ncbi:hypothetical protein GPALN_013355 [Globodera pallida]|nr:hypothetical protein GPALN_013355 [Globodera pallida]
MYGGPLGLKAKEEALPSRLPSRIQPHSRLIEALQPHQRPEYEISKNICKAACADSEHKNYLMIGRKKQSVGH